MTNQTIQIGDADSGASARVLPGFGFNCYSFEVPHDGGMLELLWSVAGFAEGNHSPSGSGIPILFPFPGRVPGAVLHWQGQEYQLVASDGLGNAIHGFVLDRPWRVLDQSDRYVVGQFQASIDEPALLSCWPADFSITTTYEVRGSVLQGRYRLENPGDQPLPCGLGTHPYFRLPLGGPQRDDCQIRVPVTAQWKLENLLANGEVLPLDKETDLVNGVDFGHLQLDNVFTGLTFQEKHCRATIRDPHSERTLCMTFNDMFQQCVLYNPPHREAICIEPYTCVPDAFQLSEATAPTGLIVLEPGQSIEGVVDIALE